MINRIIYIYFVSFVITAAACKAKTTSVNTPKEENIATEKVVVIPNISEEMTVEEKVDGTKEAINNTPKETKNGKDVTPTSDPKPASKSSDIKVEQPTQVTKTSPIKVDKPQVSSSSNDKPVTQEDEKTTQTAAKTKVPKVKDEIATEKPVTKPEKPVKVRVPFDYPNHKLFDGFLKRYVSNTGNVDYSNMKKNEADLDEYISTLETTKFNTTWTRKDKLSFWINAYNAYTIKLILNNYPVIKITDLHGGKPWDHKWIRLNGKTLSLNNIENDIIRPEFNEPRIHFAVNCAAKSCPTLLNAAYFSSTLDSQLESQTKKFINNSAFNTLTKSEITISKIFDWYGSDFGDVASYIVRYADNTVKPNATVKFKEYDWSLNGK